MEQKILPAYLRETTNLTTETFGSGLINSTWKVTDQSGTYILQRINKDVFKNPELIAYNVREIASYLKAHHPDYLFVEPIKTLDNQELVVSEDNGYYRLMPFIKHSHSIDVVSEPSQAYEAARQFGRFTALLEGMNTDLLHTTIPDFHNLSLRYRQFETAVQSGDAARIQTAAPEIAYLQEQSGIVSAYADICANPDFHQRVTHHDTKISNVLLDKNNKGLCVIDLDTVMAGYFISDVGDMLRTYLSPASEEETDLSKISIRTAIFEAIVNGYLSEMNPILTHAEKKAFIYAGKFMIYMQAIRFLTDYLNLDRYYGCRYPEHNLRRTQNQIRLLQELEKKEPELTEILNRYINNHVVNKSI
ncbi:aminoglycoside phosphotransferase family protein [Flavihumibacter sp. CACIAM 22H1]|uniref:phosphotransferase enzyme family protein n=1 Tax=Flavihumibacter sp. CACIAM 22H1 TaxID=1812911 RepID=UPI0007A89E46|nr:aminoglycoside phosphotransferase family protein [Flavihumibacter sp. CACIAM 22H1]KYP13432.1 MAG: aminoglycoside phosphotransferase [Flavihumibacter sp. CACIAM 22H1]